MINYEVNRGPAIEVRRNGGERQERAWEEVGEKRKREKKKQR